MKLLTLALTLTAISAQLQAATYDLPFKGQNFGDHEKVHTLTTPRTRRKNMVLTWALNVTTLTIAAGRR